MDQPDLRKARAPTDAGADDLHIEPFNLDTGVTAGAITRQGDDLPGLDCPSCASRNPSGNLHCEFCGARLGTPPQADRGHVAEPLRGRVLVGLGAFVAISLALILVFRSPGQTTDQSEAVPTTSISTESTAPVVAPLVAVAPNEAIASSELDGFHAAHLIDGDLESYWNDGSLRGVDAELTFRFDQPVQLAAVELVNVHVEGTFRRNYRIRGYEIHAGVEPLGRITGRLADTDQPQRIEVGLVAADTVTIHVTSTYPAESFGGDVPFDELALAEVRFFASADV